MGGFKNLLSKNPAIVLSVLVLVAGLITGLIGQPELSLVFLILGGLLLGLHTLVVTKTEAHDTAVKAASDAATTTAANLTAETVGQLGEVTEGASKVAADAVGLVTGLLEPKNPIRNLLKL